MFFKTNIDGMDLKAVQRSVPKDAIYGMQMDKVRQYLADGYHTYHAYATILCHT